MHACGCTDSSQIPVNSGVELRSGMPILGALVALAVPKLDRRTRSGLVILRRPIRGRWINPKFHMGRPRGKTAEVRPECLIATIGISVAFSSDSVDPGVEAAGSHGWNDANSIGGAKPALADRVDGTSTLSGANMSEMPAYLRSQILGLTGGGSGLAGHEVAPISTRSAQSPPEAHSL
jgi:hypothetical protein